MNYRFSILTKCILSFSIISKISLFLILLIFSSCDYLPSDLEYRKDECNLKIEELLIEEKNASTILDYELLVDEYKSLKSKMISYTNDCNKRGYIKENSEIINDISSRISKFEKLIEVENSKSDNYSTNDENFTESSSSDDDDYYANTSCTNCGMGKYNSNGICNMCSSASPSRVEESYSSQYESCLGCNATGWRGDEICPICDGKGKYMPY